MSDRPAALFAQEHWQAAEQCCHDLAAAGQADVLSRRIAGLLALRQDRAAEAVTELTAALNDAPESPALAADLGAALLAAGRRDEAVALLSQALLCEPDRFALHFLLAEASPGTTEAARHLRLAVAAASLDLPVGRITGASHTEAMRQLIADLRQAGRLRTAMQAESRLGQMVESA